MNESEIKKLAIECGMGKVPFVRLEQFAKQCSEMGINRACEILDSLPTCWRDSEHIKTALKEP